MRAIHLLTALLTLLGPVQPAFTSTDLAASKQCGLIFITRWDFELRQQAAFSVRPNGDDVRRLTSWSKRTGAVAISPDATFMIGVRYDRPTDTFSVVRASSEEGKWKQLTPEDGASYGDPQISPSSRYLAYNRSEGTNDSNLYVMDLRSRERWLVKEGARSARWTSSDERLIFSAPTGELLDRNFELFTGGRNGSSLVQLTHTPEDDELAGGVFSPDGDSILFERYPQGQVNEYDGPYADIWSMDAEGGQQKQLTDRQDHYNGVAEPRWSPDGSRISFEFVADGFKAALTAQPDGEDAELITEVGDGFSGNLYFSPDARKVLLTVQRNSRQDLLMARADGTRERWFVDSKRYEDSVLGWPAC